MNMQIKFEKGKKIIAHPSGHVDEVSKADEERFRDSLLREKAEIEKQLKDVEGDVLKMPQSEMVR